jgi:hypothetical protein
MKIKILLVIATVFLLTGCNKTIWDTTYTYKTAYCNYGGEQFELEIRQWNDYGGEQIQVKDYNGDVYLISANNCYLKG